MVASYMYSCMLAMNITIYYVLTITSTEGKSVNLAIAIDVCWSLATC